MPCTRSVCFTSTYTHTHILHQLRMITNHNVFFFLIFLYTQFNIFLLCVSTVVVIQRIAVFIPCYLCYMLIFFLYILCVLLVLRSCCRWAPWLRLAILYGYQMMMSDPMARDAILNKTPSQHFYIVLVHARERTPHAITCKRCRRSKDCAQCTRTQRRL